MTRVDIERAIIALALSDRAVAEFIASALSEDDFKNPSLKEAFIALKKVIVNSEFIDPFTVVLAVPDERSRSEILGSISLGFEALDGKSKEELAKQYVVTLMKQRLAEQFAHRLSVIAEQVRRTPLSLDEAIADAENAVAETLAKYPAEIENEDILKHIAELMAGGDNRVMSTGIQKLDWALRSAAAGDLFVIAGRTSVGKTAFAIQIAVNSALNGRRVLYVTLEMKRTEIALRFLSHIGFIPVGWFYSAAKNERILNLPFALRTFQKLPIKIVDPSAHSDAFDTPQFALALQRYMPDIAVIDYLHLMASAKDEGMVEALSELSRELKRLALRYQCVIIGLSQINRTAQASEADLEQIYYSSALAHAASQVLMLRPSQKVKTDPDSKFRVIELALVKNRNGPVTTVNSIFVPSLMRFVSCEEEVARGLAIAAARSGF